MGKILLRVELSYATTTSGALCVITSGMALMLLWSVDSLDSLQWVCIVYKSWPDGSKYTYTQLYVH